MSKDYTEMTPSELEREWEAAEPSTWQAEGLEHPEPSPMVAISFRLPEYLLNEVKAVAHARGSKYQPLLRVLIARGLRELDEGPDVPPAELHLTPEQLAQLRRTGEASVRLSAEVLPPARRVGRSRKRATARERALG